MNSNPKISVIVPVYKVEKYLDKCVESIVNQTYKNLEIILVDDGSPDNCPAMCDEWAEKDERIRVIHKENGGVSSARNAALEVATGDYIGFVDSDDWIEPDMYEYLFQNAIENGAAIARCGFYSVNELTGERTASGQYGAMKILSKNEILQRTVVGGDGGFLWNKLFHADLFEDIKFDVSKHYSEDLLVNFELAKKAQFEVFLSEEKYNYLAREREDSELEMNDHSFDPLHVMEYMLNDMKNNSEVYPYCIKGYTNSAFMLLSRTITDKKYKDRYDYLRDGILRFKKDIIFGGYHSGKDKFKMLLLWISPTTYNKVIKRIRNA